MSLVFVGVFYSFTVLIFSCSILTCPFLTITSRIGISSMLKSHFDCLKHKLCFSAIFRNQIVLSSNSFLVLAGITKLSMQFASTPSWSNFLNILFIILWNVSSELHNPKYMTCGFNKSLFVKKAAFHLSSSLIHMLLYLQIRSSLLKNFASFNLSTTSPIRGSSVLSFIITWLSFL